VVGVLFLFDCDGTIEVGVPPGPVGLADLDFLVALGARVVIVSESANCANLPFEHIVVPGNRLQALLNARAKYPNMRCIYVSDNPGDDVTAQRAGCEYVHPSEFVKRFGVRQARPTDVVEELRRDRERI
jgi:ribonucleotide monophosphatase NagD (HAD superfamily)